MASYRKRGPRQWQALVRKRGYPLQAKTFKTKAAAETWVRSLEYEMDQGMFVSRHEAETTTLGELLERYRSEYTARKRGHESESCRINTLLRHDLAQRFVATLRGGGDIARYRDERLKAISPGSLRRELTILSQVFEMARKEWGSLTWDRGMELASHKSFTLATDTEVYFCDPSSPWQRGTNKNTNRLLRQYFPKKTDLSVYSQAELNKIARKLNQRPRKTLDFTSPADKLAEVLP